MKIYKLIAIFASLALISIIVFSSINNIYATESIHIVSTRSHFDQFGNPIPNKPFYEPFPFDFQILGCPQEAIIYIHGVWTAKDKDDEDTKGMFENAPEIFERAKLSLEDRSYTFPVIGFSWDSDTEISSEGWDYAKIIAKQNGPKLAKFILDLKDNCTQTKIRLIAHSLGARVLLSSLDSLNKNQLWNANNFKIASVHLMGAAVDDDEVSKNSADVFSSGGLKAAHGKAIEEEVLDFYNLVNSEDDTLEPGYWLWGYFYPYNYSEDQPVYYPYFEQDFALGQAGIQTTIANRDVPQNYIDEPIKQEIRNIIDADADEECDLIFSSCTIKYVGDNHFGYIGFRGPNDSLIDNGAMEIVVDTFRNSP